VLNELLNGLLMASFHVVSLPAGRLGVVGRTRSGKTFSVVRMGGGEVG